MLAMVANEAESYLEVCNSKKIDLIRCIEIVESGAHRHAEVQEAHEE